MKNTICMCCHQKGSSQSLYALQKLQTYLISVVEPVGRPLNLLWQSRKRCKYGMPCSEMEIQEQHEKRLETEIEPYLTGISELLGYK